VRSMKQRHMTKAALAFSACMLLLWALLGTNATLAWFSDSAAPVKNTLVFGNLDLDVAYKNAEMTDYATMGNNSKVFGEKEALYEPGYTQVVYLKIENKGDVPFDYKLSVDVNSYTQSTNVQGRNFILPPYLRYGVIFGESEAVLDRRLAQASAGLDMGRHNYDQANLPLNIYSDIVRGVDVGEIRYAAVIVYMPENVGNQANHSSDFPAPMVDLGLTVLAQQVNTLN